MDSERWAKLKSALELRLYQAWEGPLDKTIDDMYEEGIITKSEQQDLALYIDWGITMNRLEDCK